MTMNSTTIRVSTELVEAAREIARWSERTVPGQIEHWALLGKALEGQLPADSTIALKKAASSASQETLTKEVAAAFALLGKLHGTLPTKSFPEKLVKIHNVRYETDTNHPGQIVQIDASGKRTSGKLVSRRFVPSR